MKNQNQSQDTQLAFKDFKNAVTQEEFAAVMEVVEAEYFLLNEVLKKRHKFVDKLKTSQPDIENMPPGLLDKLSDGFLRHCDKELLSLYKNNLKRSKVLVDFINRFKQVDDMLEYHDLSFLENLKTKK